MKPSRRYFLFGAKAGLIITHLIGMLSLFANPSDPDYMALHLIYALWIFGVCLVFGAALLSAGFERKVERAIWIANTVGCAVCLSVTYLPWTNTWWAEQLGWRGVVEDILYLTAHTLLLGFAFWIMRGVRDWTAAADSSSEVKLI